jgi:orotidine-5'-phosphate decarboxylase
MTGLLLALDVPDVTRAVNIASQARPFVSGYKVGLELLMASEPGAVERIGEFGLPIFVDAKLHDIPATVEKAARQLGSRGARWLTIHASGGTEMLAAGVAGLSEGSGGSGGVLAVTVLTSLNDADLASIGFVPDVEAQTQRMVDLAVSAGTEGVICSVPEVVLVQSRSSLITVTPGIRPTGSDHHDQKRASTPAEAAAAGASFVVVGRPITGAEDVAVAAAAIADELTGAITSSDGFDGS